MYTLKSGRHTVVYKKVAWFIIPVKLIKSYKSEERRPHTKGRVFFGKYKSRIKIKICIVSSELISYFNEWMWRENVVIGKFTTLTELCKFLSLKCFILFICCFPYL
jgi:hypothetical protein